MFDMPAALPTPATGMAPGTPRFTYAFDQAGELVSAGGTTYTYDEAGNLVQAGSDSFGWDHDSHLVQAEVGSHTAAYTYDGDGVRVGATVDQASSSFLTDREAGLSVVVGDQTSSYVHAGGLLEAVTGTQGAWALGDRLGSIRGLSSDAGTVVGTASYEAFGSPRATSGTQSLFGFTGEPTDATGLVYLRSRFLDPGTGRMLSADTVMPNAAGTLGYNLYAYAADDPTTWTDPTGHSPLSAALAPWLALLMVAGSAALLSGGVLGAVGGAAEIAGPAIPFIVGAGIAAIFLMCMVLPDCHTELDPHRWTPDSVGREAPGRESPWGTNRPGTRPSSRSRR